MSVKVVMTPGGLRQIRYSPAVKALLERHGQRVTAAANATLKHGHKGYLMSSRAGAPRPSGRWRVTVAAVSPYAKRSNAIHHTLIKSLH